MFHLETVVVTPKPLMEEESRRVYNCGIDHLSESTKCSISKVCEIHSTIVAVNLHDILE